MRPFPNYPKINSIDVRGKSPNLHNFEFEKALCGKVSAKVVHDPFF